MLLHLPNRYLEMFNILSYIVVGFIAGLCARALLPGADTMGFIQTTLVGIAGSVVGGFVGNLIKKPAADSKFHPAGILMSIVGAMVLLYAMRFLK